MAIHPPSNVSTPPQLVSHHHAAHLSSTSFIALYGPWVHSSVLMIAHTPLSPPQVRHIPMAMVVYNGWSLSQEKAIVVEHFLSRARSCGRNSLFQPLSLAWGRFQERIGFGCSTWIRGRRIRTTCTPSLKLETNGKLSLRTKRTQPIKPTSSEIPRCNNCWWLALLVVSVPIKIP